MSGGQTLLLIDLSGLYWSHWHATADQEISQAFERTIATVRAMRGEADLVAICIDMPPYWRREILPDYKANREAAPPVAVEQFERAKTRLRADGFLLWGAPGFEADDVIAWAVKQALDDETISGVAIASSDKDLHQLVSDRVRCYSFATKKVYGPDQVIEKHGSPPHQMLDHLSLVGDSSDNVPGVPGVGPKNAAALLKTFFTLEGVLNEAAKPVGESRITKPAIKSALIEHADSARLARRVIALRTDVPLDWSELRMERKQETIVEANAANLDGDEEQPAETAKTPSAPPPPATNGNGNGNGKHAEQASQRTQALTVRAPEEWSLALEPRSSRGAWEAAKMLFNSRLYKNYGSAEAIYAVILRGRGLGMDATTSLAAFHNIKDKLAMHADLIEALVLRSGKAEYFEWTESTNKIATYITKRIGSRREQVLSFTIEDAFAMGLVIKDERGMDGYLGVSESGKPSSWDKTRRAMLRHRCKTELARSVYSDVVLGLYTPDEIEEPRIVEMVAA